MPKSCLVTALALSADGSEGHCPESKAWWEGLNGEHSVFITCCVFHLSHLGSPPWVGKIPWRRAWRPTSVFLSGKSPWTEEPGGLQPGGVGKSWTRLSNSAQHSTVFPKAPFLPFYYQSRNPYASRVLTMAMKANDVFNFI